MAGSMGRALIQTTLQDSFTVVDRRLSGIDARERGIGRGDWLPAAWDYDTGLTLPPGWPEPTWRVLNDGRIELRGRYAIPTQINNGDVVMAISVWYVPDPAVPTNRYPLPLAQPPLGSSVSILLPVCSTGDNPGVMRADVVGERREPPDPEAEGPDTALIIARPPENKPLTGWVGFDHAVYDPHLYLDVVNPVPAPSRQSVFGARDYGVAILSRGGTNRIATPGVIPVEWTEPPPSEETP